MYGVMRSAADARCQAIGALDGDPLVYEGPANLLRRWEGVGGWLALSPQWLVFASHRFNWQTGRLLLPVAQIQEATPRWAKLFGLPLVPTVLAVRSKPGREYQFVVRGRQRWAELIRCLCAE